MMTTKKYNHIHKLRRDRYSTGRSFYYCVNGDCNFKIDVKHSLGKTNLCNKCGKPFEMNEYSIRAAKPKCFDCIARKSFSNSAILDELNLGELNANNVDRNSSTITSKTEVHSDSINELEKQLSNLIVRTYNPEDDDDKL